MPDGVILVAGDDPGLAIYKIKSWEKIKRPRFCKYYSSNQLNIF